MKKRTIMLFCIIIIAAALGGAILFPTKGWAWASLLIAVAALVLAFSAFEGRPAAGRGSRYPGSVMCAFRLLPCRFRLVAAL